MINRAFDANKLSGRTMRVFNLVGKVLKAGVPYGMKVKNGFVFRDLRTTADTLMVRAGLQDVYRRALMGHTQKGMDQHYTHPDFEKDLRQAMEKYTSWLGGQIQNVTPFVTQRTA